jgi:cytochrome P450
MDPYFFDEIYGSRKTEKDAAFVPIFTLPDATVATVGHDHHRYRRGILNNFFSKRSVSKLEGLIHEKTEKACQHLEEACKNGTIVSMDALSAALTADVISHYAYGRSSGILDDKSLKNDFRDAINGIADIAHYTRFFPVLVTLLNAIPPSIIRKLQPKARGMLDAKEMLWKRSVAALEDSRLGRRSKETGSTIFDTLSDTSVVPEERTLARLRDEGLSLLAAGTETTSRVLAVASFHLLSDKTMWLRLREELKQVMPTPTSTATWAQLEQLPYLVCIHPG